MQIIFLFNHLFFIDIKYLKKFGREFEDLHSEAHCFDAAREVHEKLSDLLSDKRTFFDLPREEFKDEEEK